MLSLPCNGISFLDVFVDVFPPEPLLRSRRRASTFCKTPFKKLSTSTRLLGEQAL